MWTHETGQDLGSDLTGAIGAGLGDVLASPEAQLGMQAALVDALNSEPVQDSMARAARPIMLEGSLYLGIAVALAVWIGRR
jgi:hypothetical protein